MDKFVKALIVACVAMFITVGCGDKTKTGSEKTGKTEKTEKTK